MTATAFRQGTDAWLDARRQGVGASDIPVIAGESPYRSALALWATKTGRVTEEIDADQADLFEIGHLMEPVLLAIYERRTGRKTRRTPRMLAHPDIPWALASLDAQAPVKRVVEAKWTNSTRWPAEGIPADVLLQCQWQLFVTGWDVADVVALVGRSPRIVEVPRDQELIDGLYRLACDFWRHVTDDTEPAPDGSDSAHQTLSRLHPTDDGTVIPATADLVELVESLRAAKAAAKAAGDAEKSVGNAIRAIVGDASGVEGLLTYRQNAASTRTNWPAVASEFRALLTDRDAVELDAVVSIHSETTPGPRVLRLSKETAA